MPVHARVRSLVFGMVVKCFGASLQSFTFNSTGALRSGIGATYSRADWRADVRAGYAEVEGG
eukprot:8018256-Heterocapsa_arctica.AAC.1